MRHHKVEFFISRLETDGVLDIATVMSVTASLDVFFNPKSIAVIGATDKAGHLGRALMRNLVANASERAIYAVNSRRSTVFGMRAHPNIQSIPASER